MSVRQRKWTDKQGRVRTTYMIHVVVTLPNGRRAEVRKTSPVPTRKGALAYERQVREQLLAGTWGKEEAQLPTIAEYAEDFLANARDRLKPSTVQEYEATIRLHLLPELGHERLDEVRPREIRQLVSVLRKSGMQPKTINNVLSVLSGMLKLACDDELLTHVPRIKRLKTEEPTFDFLDFDEAEQLIEAAAVEPEWQRLIVVALNTGLRRGELLALRWENVDLRARKLVVRRSTTRNVETAPKNWKPRTIPLNDRALEALRAHRHLRGPLVFCREDGSAIADHQVRPVLRRTCKRAGLRMIGAHTMRHSFASHLAIRGASIKVIQELLGHSDIKVTMRYAHLSPAARGHAVELLGPSKSTLGAHGDGSSSGR